MFKSQTLIALALILTACGSDEGDEAQTTSFSASTGGAAGTTVEGATGGSSLKATGGSITGLMTVGGSAPKATGGSSGQVTTTSAGGSSTTTGAGGESSTGGSSTTTTGGSNPGTGGSSATGGSSTTTTGGSNPSTGGNLSTGGSNPGTGGSSTTGGKTSTGGSSTTTTGGSNPGTGGSSATGGSSTTGGSSATGGSQPSTGGSNPGTGGNPSTGGTPATGGSDLGTGGSDPGTGGSDPGVGGSDPGTGGTPASGGSSTTTTGGAAPTVNTLYEGISVPVGTYPGSESHGSLRTDASNLYWATYRDLSSGSTTISSIIRKAPKTGGASTTIVTAPSGSAVGDLVVAGGYIYWMEWVRSTGQVKINKATVDGASPTTLTTIASPYGTTRPLLLALRTDGTYLFWVATPVIQYDTTGWASDTFTRIDQISVNGGAVSTLATVTGGATWDVTLGGDTSVLCYKMIVAGTYSPTYNWWGNARPFMHCSSPTNPMVNMGQIPSFTDLPSSVDGSTTYSNLYVYLHNSYGISDTFRTTAENTLLKVQNTGDYLNSDATHLFYLLNGQIYQANLTTFDSQPLAPVTSLRIMTSDGTTLFWVDGVNIYSKTKL